MLRETSPAAGHNIIESSSGFTLAGTDFSGAITLPAVSTDSVTGHSYYVVSAGGQAQDGGNPTGAPSTDIRGFVRDSAPDIGSYELNTAPVLDNTGARL
ncbi:MAG: choice-of-anchor Q domain-containing protein [Planctomycetaceae bacterium]